MGPGKVAKKGANTLPRSQAEGWESAKRGHGIERKGAHPQAPSCALIRVAVHTHACTSPLGTPTAADGPTEGVFICANPSAAVPVAHWPPSGARGPTFAPLSTTGLGFLRGRKIPGYVLARNNVRECSHVRVFIPGPYLT